jgi:hypothetical protein
MLILNRNIIAIGGARCQFQLGIAHIRNAYVGCMACMRQGLIPLCQSEPITRHGKDRYTHLQGAPHVVRCIMNPIYALLIFNRLNSASV